MTKTFLSIGILCIICQLNLWAQDTLVIVSNDTNSKDADISSYYGDSNYGSSQRFRATTWSISGGTNINRAALAFNLADIDRNATVVSAKLDLYHQADFEQSTLSGSNACTISRIIEDWSENTITWNNQPASTPENQANLPASTSATQDYLDIDVTELVKIMIAKPDSNFGFLLRLVTEVKYRTLNFASSENTTETMRPKLTIVLAKSEASQTALITAEDSNSKDADISSYYPDANYGSAPRFRSSAWSISGGTNLMRAVLAFDLSSICKDATVNEAKLNLYHQEDFEQSALTGSNACYLSRIMEDWSESTVTWNNQPTTALENRKMIEASTIATQDYEDIDVTELVKTMVAKPDSNFGFLISLIEESTYRTLNFASSEYANATRRPSLSIKYTNAPTCDNQHIITGTEPINKDVLLSLYPNPTGGSVTVDINLDELCNIEILNTLGQVIYQASAATGQGKQEIDLGSMGPAGLYVVRVRDSKNKLIGIQKVLLN